MKKFIYYILCSCCAIGALTSCEKDLEVYDTDTCWLNFYYDILGRYQYEEKMSKTSYSFVYGSSDRQRDTIWLEMKAIGKVYDHDRAIQLEQVPTDGAQAVAGKHFVAFNDPSVAHLYVMPAGKSQTKIPIIVLRDPSLKNEIVNLKLEIRANENFVPGYPEYSYRYLSITDMLSEPSYWNHVFPYPGYAEFGYTLCFADDYFGPYGVVKHQFLIDHTGLKFDDEFIYKTMIEDLNDDYLSYLVKKMRKVLAEVNAERQAQGLDVLKEADGTEVSF